MRHPFFIQNFELAFYSIMVRELSKFGFVHKELVHFAVSGIELEFGLWFFGSIWDDLEHVV